MVAKLTNEIVDERLKGRNIQRLEDVVNAQTKIKWKCLKDGHIWATTQACILNENSGCPRCANKIRFTDDIVDERLKYKNIIRLENVKNSYTKIKWKCLKDGFIWEATPGDICSHSGCPKCSNVARLTNVSVDERLKNRYIQRLDDVVNAQTKIKWKCLKDGHIWNATPANVINHNSNCPKCANSLPLTNEIVDERLKDRDIQRLEDVKNSRTIIKWKCLNDGHIWESSPNSILHRNYGCPKCSPKSKGEELISTILDRNNIKYTPQKRFSGCKHKKTLPFDFHLDGTNILIEYQGKQHFEAVTFGGTAYTTKAEHTFAEQTIKDKIKKEWADKNKYDMIYFTYKDTMEEIINKIEFLSSFEQGEEYNEAG